MSGPRPPEVSSKFRQWFVNAESGDNRSFWILRYQSQKSCQKNCRSGSGREGSSPELSMFISSMRAAFQSLFANCRADRSR